MKLCNCSCLIFFFFLISLSDSNPDFESLLEFKKSTDISNSLSTWSNSTNPCSGSWLGITCDKENRVTRLVLENLDLTGSIQTLTQLDRLRLLSLKNNNLSSFPSSSSSQLSLSSWQNMKLLYLSHNQFTGNFPSGVTQLRRLRRLDLSHNGFSGNIPVTQLLELPHLITLRLEDNSFTGLLPPARPIDFLNLMDFNVSRNNLFGQIPVPFNSFPASSFTGNKNLCGKPLLNKCMNQSTAQSDPYPIRLPPVPKHHKLTQKSILAITLIDVTLVLIMLLVIVLLCRKRRKQSNLQDPKNGFDGKKMMMRVKREDEVMVLFEGCLGLLGVDDLLKSSAEMLGKGNVGTSYKVVMETGEIVVVKRARERKKKKKEVDGFLREIGGLRHRNLVSLRAYYCSRDELLLVYDFLPNGSLNSLLHGNRGPGRTPLGWTTRLNYAAGAAEGLAFLHAANKSKHCHGHLTSSNIVIDREGNACISDVALHQLFPTATTTSNNGYNAPELIHGGSTYYRKFSQKSDVYSFGVILLEILTGKTAFSEGEETSFLAKWVQSVVREEWTSEVFDIELLQDKDIEEEMMTLLQIALLCLARSPGERPRMSAVHKMIEDVKTKGSQRVIIYPHSVSDLSTDSSPSHLSNDSMPTFTN